VHISTLISPSIWEFSFDRTEFRNFSLKKKTIQINFTERSSDREKKWSQLEESRWRERLKIVMRKFSVRAEQNRFQFHQHFTSSFSPITVCHFKFLAKGRKNIGAKAARKMLMKLVLISPTFYNQVFCTELFSKACS